MLVADESILDLSAMQIDKSGSNRCGVTLIELFVVIGVILIMLAILLPAVFATRQVVRQTVCTNNLHQIGIAVSNFHQKNGTLPSLHFELSQLASELEIATYDDEDFGRLIKVATSVLKCPAEPFRGGHPETEVNYFMNLGSGISPLNGAAAPYMDRAGKHVKLSFKDFTDGLSNTAIFSEHLQLQVDCILCHPSTKFWRSNDAFGIGQEAMLREYLKNPENVARFTPLMRTIIAESTSLDNTFYYDHLWVPNRPMVSILSASYSTVQPPSSAHSGGVNVLFADGNVRFFSDQVDELVWAAVGSRNGGEAISHE